MVAPRLPETVRALLHAGRMDFEASIAAGLVRRQARTRVLSAGSGWTTEQIVEPDYVLWSWERARNRRGDEIDDLAEQLSEVTLEGTPPSIRESGGRIILPQLLEAAARQAPNAQEVIRAVELLFATGRLEVDALWGIGGLAVRDSLEFAAGALVRASDTLRSRAFSVFAQHDGMHNSEVFFAVRRTVPWDAARTGWRDPSSRSALAALRIATRLDLSFVGPQLEGVVFGGAMFAGQPGRNWVSYSSQSPRHIPAPRRSRTEERVRAGVRGYVRAKRNLGIFASATGYPSISRR